MQLTFLKYLISTKIEPRDYEREHQIKAFQMFLFPVSKQFFLNDIHVDKLHNQYDLQYKFNIYQA